MTSSKETHDGGCTCGEVRYRMTSNPLIVHGCHCRWCQRQSGSAFAINALIESERVELLKGAVEEIVTPSPSGKGQQIARCPTCKVAVWSNYWFSGLYEWIRFIRVGSLDEPDYFPPDVHIFTMSKQPWVILPAGDKAVEEYYITRETWSKSSLERLDKVVAAAGLET